jgi:hypothetical protein
MGSLSGAESREIENLPESWQSEPQEEDKLEGVVEGEPVDDVDETLDEAVEVSKSIYGKVWTVHLREEAEDNPVLLHLYVSPDLHRARTSTPTVSHCVSSLVPDVNKASRE